MKISIVIPVYNAIHYLQQCVDSLLQQTYQSLEVLLIDDESSDGSAILCDELAKSDKRIRVIHQQNAGTSAARNTGLKMASGDYVTFIDNDDYWKDTSCLLNIVKQLEESQSDVLLFSTIDYWEEQNQFFYPKLSCSRSEVVNQPKETALRNIMEKGLLYRAVWSKIIKRELILANQLYFVPGIRNEDSDWTARMLLVANRYDWYEKPFYVYRKGHIGAQTSKPNSYQTVCDLKNFCVKYISLIENGAYEAEFKKVFLSYVAYPYSVWMAQAQFLKNTAIKSDIREMKQYAYVLNYDLDPSVKLVKKLYKIIGYKWTSFLLKCYMKHKYHMLEE